MTDYVPRLIRLDRFNADSALLTPAHGRALADVARRIVASWARGRPIREVRLTGHTDSRSADSYNHRLGLGRARAVRTALFAALERLRPGLTCRIKSAIRSAGPTHAIEPRNLPAGRARNRRVTLCLGPESPSPELSSASIMTYDFEGPSPPQVGTPQLIYRGAGPPKTTFYVKIVLGKESPADPMTGIFLPAAFTARERIDVVLYLHGHNDDGARPRNLGINDYWRQATYPNWNLREGFNTSQFDGVLVAPNLGPRSEGGRLTEKDGLSWYLDRVLLALRAYGPFPNTAKLQLGNLIVACHSGGGRPMLQIALSKQRFSENIQEFWGFDCLYNDCDDAAWDAWARLNPTKRLFIDYGDGGTKSLSERLRAKAKDLPNVSVTGSVRTKHLWVPNRNWVKRLTAARSLLQP